MTWLTWNVIAVGKYGEVWICTRLSRMTVKWVCALFQQRGGGGDVIVIVLVVASRTMLQQTVAPNIYNALYNQHKLLACRPTDAPSVAPSRVNYKIFAVLVVRVYHVVLTPSFKLLSFVHLLY